MASFDIETNAVLTPYLLAGESIKWSGRPRSGLMLSPQDAFVIPFSLLWCGGAIFWTVTALQKGAPNFFVAYGSAFVLFGLFFVLGRFFVDAWVRQSTHYAVSNQRILIIRTRPSVKLTALPLSRVAGATLSLHAKGRGSIGFGAEVTSSGTLFGTNRSPGNMIPSLGSAPTFIAIENATEVFRLIQDLPGH